MLAFKTGIVSMQIVDSEVIFTKSNIEFCIHIGRIIIKIRLHAKTQNDNSLYNDKMHVIKYDFARTEQNSYA